MTTAPAGSVSSRPTRSYPTPRTDGLTRCAAKANLRPVPDPSSMILDLSSLLSLLENCPPRAASEKVARCGWAVLVALAVFARLPRNESFTLSKRLGQLSITQQALLGIKSKIIRATPEG